MMHRFLCEGSVLQTGATVALGKEEAQHAAKVLRLQAGDRVEVCDGRGGLFEGVIASAQRDDVRVSLDTPLDGREAPLRLTLYMGLPKAEKLELVVQKLTEIGACAVVPVLMERSVPKPGGDKSNRQERLSRIAREAMKQCGRAYLPDVSEPVRLDRALDMMKKHDCMLVPWEEASGLRLVDVYKEMPSARDIGVLIGPEGGITAEEANKAREAGGRLVTLGPRILRCETAAIAACAAVMTLWGDL